MASLPFRLSDPGGIFGPYVERMGEYNPASKDITLRFVSHDGLSGGPVTYRPGDVVYPYVHRQVLNLTGQQLRQTPSPAPLIQYAPRFATKIGEPADVIAPGDDLDRILTVA